MNDEPYIVTYTGRKINPLNPKPEDICIEDIAHALSMKCRFSGHVTWFTSVAHHSIIVSRFFHIDPLWGLLHDAGEAYLPDVPSPIKQYLPGLNLAEEACMEAIKDTFGLRNLAQYEREMLLKIDRAALMLEWNTLINNPNGYEVGFDVAGLPKLDYPLVPNLLSPNLAEACFLERYSYLIEIGDEDNGSTNKK